MVMRKIVAFESNYVEEQMKNFCIDIEIGNYVTNCGSYIQVW